MSHTAQIVSLTEFQSRRAVMEMRSRSTPRQFLWGFPGMTMVLGFRPRRGVRVAIAHASCECAVE